MLANSFKAGLLGNLPILDDVDLISLTKIAFCIGYRLPESLIGVDKHKGGDL